MKRKNIFTLLSLLLAFLISGCEEVTSVDYTDNFDTDEYISIDEAQEAETTADEIDSSTTEDVVTEDSLEEATADESANEIDINDVSENESLDIEITDTEEHVHYEFRNDKLLEQHYEKHGVEMGFDSIDDYQEAACDVINNPDALYKVEAEDGDGVYYVEDTNEFVVVSTDGYIRTYFEPSSGKKYFDRQ